MAANTRNGNVVTTAELGATSSRKLAVRKSKSKDLVQMLVKNQFSKKQRTA